MAVALEFKVIQAEKMNIKAIEREILKQLTKEEQIAARLLGQTIKAWKGSKPKFETKRVARGNDLISNVFPGGNSEGIKKWTILDKGSPPHRIAARRAPALAFRQGGFRPKTKVGNLRSESGRAATGPLRRPLSVPHPGTKARVWSQTATKQRENPFQRNMRAANNRGAGKLY